MLLVQLVLKLVLMLLLLVLGLKRCYEVGGVRSGRRSIMTEVALGYGLGLMQPSLELCRGAAVGAWILDGPRGNASVVAVAAAADVGATWSSRYLGLME